MGSVNEGAIGWVWWILAFPLAGFSIQALLGKAIVDRFGRPTGRKIMGWLAVLPIVAAFVVGVAITHQLTQMPPSSRHAVQTLFDWIAIRGLHIPFEVVVDRLTMTMVLIVTGVGALIHLYATGYMADDRDYTRFFTYLNLFIAFMLILVMGNNLALLFIGWEGVGLCSYLLIGFWYGDLANARAANKAFIVNRIGDWGLTLGIFMLATFMWLHLDSLLVVQDRWLSYDVFIPNAQRLLVHYPVEATAIALLFFVGACGKSAQFPLYFWLPDAMAGPTPVSALIHAATMVTAGVFLLNRVHVLFEASPIASAVVAGIGAFTALFAALVAFGQTDIKKVLAYSTVSQLGYMFIGCGVGAFWAGMFHVTTHAFFKALLFLGAGAVIYSMLHEQDMRRYGNLRKYLPITFVTMTIGWLAISGFPYLSGFFSKEAILGAALGNTFAVYDGYNVGVIAGWVGLAVAALTAAYMTRMTWLTFWGKEERWRLAAETSTHAHHGAESQETHEAHPIEEDLHGFYYAPHEVGALEGDHEHHAHLTPDYRPKEAPPSMSLPLVVLALLSLAGGWLLAQGHLFEKWLYPDGLALLSPEMVAGHPHGWVGQSLMAMSIAAAFAGMLYGIIVYWRGLPKGEADERTWNPLRRLAGHQFGYDSAVMDAGVLGGREIGNVLWRGVDVKGVDGIVNGVAMVLGKFGEGFRTIQTGYVRGYALLMFVGGAALLGYFLYVMSRLGAGQ
jgi:NADH-quinone oxidoreductase subunit L